MFITNQYHSSYMAEFSFTVSSITSRLAFAIIWTTCLSCPAPITGGRLPLLARALFAEAAAEAPDRAATVPAKADVDHEGRLDDKGRADVADGRLERWVREYRGVSVGESKNK